MYHVTNFSILNYILFILLLLITLSFKQWKKLILLIISIVFSFIVGMSFIVYGNFSPKLELLKSLILFLIFSLAIWNVLSLKKIFKEAKNYIFLFAILFGFFNGVGTSSALLAQLERNESEIMPLLEVTFAMGSAVFLFFLGLMSILTLIRKVPKVNIKNSVMFSSIAAVTIVVVVLISQIFN